jgi:hypothetical protein
MATLNNDPPVEMRIDTAGAELYDDKNEEHKLLRKVPGELNWMLFAVCVIEMGERFVYNGISGPLQNYVQSVPSELGCPRTRC